MQDCPVILFYYASYTILPPPSQYALDTTYYNNNTQGGSFSIFCIFQHCALEYNIPSDKMPN